MSNINTSIPVPFWASTKVTAKYSGPKANSGLSPVAFVLHAKKLKMAGGYVVAQSRTTKENKY